ncbi:hypothetical protein B5S28_g429 [[Candida] boidinii]|nr:hypothetical protein B5S28_g429 [[Candida] boidinii]
MNHIREYDSSSDDDSEDEIINDTDTNSNKISLDDPPIELDLRFSKTPSFIKKDNINNINNNNNNNNNDNDNSITSFIYIPIELNNNQYKLISIYNNYVSQELNKHMNEFNYGDKNSDDNCLYSIKNYSNNKELHISLCYNFRISLNKINEFKENLINITNNHLKNLKNLKFKSDITLIPNKLTIFNKNEYENEYKDDDIYDKIFIALKLTEQSQFKLKEFLSAVNYLIESLCEESQSEKSHGRQKPVQPYDFHELHCSIGEIDINTRRAATLHDSDRLFFQLQEFLEGFQQQQQQQQQQEIPGPHPAEQISVSPDAVMMTQGRRLFRAALQRRE